MNDTPTPRSAQKTILVVDDEPDLRQYLRTLLEDAGFTVVTAEDGQVAIEKIREHPPDLISLDLVMPRKSGHRLLFELKRDKQLARIPVLVLTAHARTDLGKPDLEDLLQNRILSGPGTYLEKPVQPKTYLRSIQRALGLEETPRQEDRLDLKAELDRTIQGASREALQKALEILRRNPPKQ
jgi:CheY-like chemotaxis protein